jgi:DNA-binding transcriptional ArsR family regulator
MRNTTKVFRALADPTRRQILQELKDTELAAGAIAALFQISGPSISRHLTILKEAELVKERRDGNRILYRLLEKNLAMHVGDFLSAVCPTQMVQRNKINQRKHSL